jgi:hypothetical protein
VRRTSISRWMTLGSVKRYQTDDYLMMLALCFYTTLVATINIVRNTSSNLLPPGYDVDMLSKSDIQERRYGSKLILVVEQSQCCTIWLAKACLLVMYLRLTTVRRENIFIKILCGYVAFGFVFMEIFYFGVWCRPFYLYWAVPTPNIQCSAATDHLITNAVFNLSSDSVMLAIGLPMFLRLKLPWRKKVPMIGIFSLGVFVILAAVLNKVYSFSQPFGSLWTYWYVRESSTALLVANLPFVWTFWRRAISGSNSINGMSRQNSHSPEDIMSGTEKGRSKPRSMSKRRNSLPWSKYATDAATNDVELGASKPRQSAGMTLDEILSESNTDLTEGEKITPYTHPALFYSRQAREHEAQLAMEKAVLGEGGSKSLVRRDSASDQHIERTPVSSVFPHSLGSHRTADSFL